MPALVHNFLWQLYLRVNSTIKLQVQVLHICVCMNIMKFHSKFIQIWNSYEIHTYIKYI